MTTGFFGELWQEYRNVAKLLVGTLIELVAILLTLRGEQWLVATLGLAVPPAGSCTLSNFFECLHSFVVDLLVVMLLGSFIVVSAVFIYRRSAHQIRSQQLEEVKEYSKGLVKESNKYNEGLVGAITSMEAGATDQDRIRAIEMLMRLRESYPTDRKVNILLGRLHKIRGDYAAAVEAMTWVI